MTNPRQPRMPLPRLRRAPARRQRGVYALEWAIIFPVFFLLLYGIICYGLTFLVRESMQFAVEEGARAALRLPRSSLIGTNPPTWPDRRAEARLTVIERLDWLPAGLKPALSDIDFVVCPMSDSACLEKSRQEDLGAGLQDFSLLCDVNMPCIVKVSYNIDNYQVQALAPAIPGLGLLLPSSLQATSSIMVDRRML